MLIEFHFFFLFTIEMQEFYPEDHSSYADCQGALVMLSRTSECIRQQLDDSENFQLLCELQRDLGGFSSLVNNNRLFIRQGCLLKHSKRGLQQRIFFLVRYLTATSMYLDLIVSCCFFFSSRTFFCTAQNRQ